MANFSATEALEACSYLFLAHIGEVEENSLCLVIEEGIVSKHSESLEMAGVTIPDIRPIEVTAASRRFEIYWPSYVSYAIRNESYCSWDDQEQWSGENLRVYSDSKFLDFVATGTFADEQYPGPFKHYGIICSNHVIDVASEDAPTIRYLVGA